MICDPFICIHTDRLGAIEWFSTLSDGRIGKDGSALFHQEAWVPYADFEREKLRELGVKCSIGLSCSGYPVDAGRGFELFAYSVQHYWSSHLIGYSYHKYLLDSESGRLLKRAEFLRRVCEAEGIEWIPKDTRQDETCDAPKSKKPERNYYSREEINEIMKELLDAIEHLPSWLDKRTVRDNIIEFRDRFLPKND